MAALIFTNQKNTLKQMKEMIKDKQAKRLGFKKLETAEIVSRLNITLCTYQVFFHKLQNFHWNVVGSDFFDVHDITQEMYEKSLKYIDDIAERIRVFGEVPEVKMSEYLKHSIVEESPYDKSAEFMFYDIIADLEKLTETFLDVYEHAANNGDIGTAHMVSKYVKDLETYHWQLSAWTKQKLS